MSFRIPRPREPNVRARRERWGGGDVCVPDLSWSAATPLECVFDMMIVYQTRPMSTTEVPAVYYSKCWALAETHRARFRGT
jgi:hypothetical protein